MKNLDAFPPGVDVPFLGAWIENESDGRHDAESSLEEIGYFQLHPDEIADMAGADQVEVVQQQIRSSKTASLRWGGTLLRHYDDAIQKLGIPRGTRLYQALLKLMHASRPRGVRWVQHVQAVLGRNPTSYEEFLRVAVSLFEHKTQPEIASKLPTKLPSCAPTQFLQRRSAFLNTEGAAFPVDRRPERPVLHPLYVAASHAASASALFMGSERFPGVVFGPPVPAPYARVSSGWWQPRTRGTVQGHHQGMDFPALMGTPVFSVADGVVEGVHEGEFAGTFVVIQHPGGWTSRYMHLSEAIAQAGQPVPRGTLIGRVGVSGVQRSGPHLHFDLLLTEDRLPYYTALFGKPSTGYGTQRALGTGVPAEPLIPVVAYESDVTRDAAQHGIPLYSAPERPFAWGKTFAMIGTGALVGALGLLYARRKKR